MDGRVSNEAEVAYRTGSRNDRWSAGGGAPSRSGKNGRRTQWLQIWSVVFGSTLNVNPLTKSFMVTAGQQCPRQMAQFARQM